MVNNIKDLSVPDFPPTNQEETRINFVDNCLPTEIILKIFSNLNVFELVRSQRVGKPWKEVVSEKVLRNAGIPEIIGETHWMKYFGNVGKVPPLPQDIEKILEGPCPFFSGKKVKETHMLVLIPETIDGKPLTLEVLSQLVKAPKEGNPTECSIFCDIAQKYNQATPKAHWVLMTKDVIEGSRNKDYIDQGALLAECNKKTGMNYEVPNALDASICISMHYISSGERLFLFDSNSSTFTRCIEDYMGFQQIIIGSFLPLGGFSILFNGIAQADIGVAALQKF